MAFFLQIYTPNHCKKNTPTSSISAARDALVFPENVKAEASPTEKTEPRRFPVGRFAVGRLGGWFSLSDDFFKRHFIGYFRDDFEFSRLLGKSKEVGRFWGGSCAWGTFGEDLGGSGGWLGVMMCFIITEGRASCDAWHIPFLKFVWPGQAYFWPDAKRRFRWRLMSGMTHSDLVMFVGAKGNGKGSANQQPGLQGSKVSKLSPSTS